MQRETLSSFDGTRLHALHLKPESGKVIKATILWVHGAFEHSGRYEEVMRFFAAKGYQSICYDQRGHGRSGGTKMFLKSFDDYLRDLTAVYKYFADEVKAPLFLVGHSMGGLVALRHRQQYDGQVPFRAAVLSSPFLGEAMAVPGWKKAMSKLTVAIAPKISVPTGLPAEGISRNPEVVTRYKQDPLIRTKTTPGWYESILKAHQQAFIQAPTTPGPLHILMAGDDQLVSTDATRKLYAALPDSIEKSFQEYENYYHEIFNDVGKEQVFTDLEAIFDRYLKSETAED